MTAPFPVTLESIVSQVQTSVSTSRSLMGLPALTGPDGAATGTIALGQEFLDFQLSPPMIIIVPSDESFGPASNDGNSDGTAPTIAKLFYTSAMTFQAWCWGDEDPNFAASGNTTYSFDSTIELRRELIFALLGLGGIPEIGRMSGRWEQPANVKKLGRMYVLTFELKLPINDATIANVEVLPFATDETSGVQMSATIFITSADESTSTEAGVIIAPPP